MKKLPRQYTQYVFKFIPPQEMGLDDPMWEIFTPDGKKTNVQIQDSRSYGGGFGVNEYAPDMSWVQEVGGMYRALAAAKVVAESYLNKHLKKVA